MRRQQNKESAGSCGPEEFAITGKQRTALSSSDLEPAMRYGTRSRGIFIAVLGAVILYWGLADRLGSFNPAMGSFAAEKEEVREPAAFQGHSLMVIEPNWDKKVSAALSALRSAGKPTVMILGNSQLHTIVGATGKDNFAVYYLNSKAQRDHSDLHYVQFSAPNIRLVEYLGIYYRLRERGLLPDYLILGVCYGHSNWAEIREGILEAIPEIPVTSEDSYDQWGPGMRRLAETVHAARSSRSSKNKPSNETPQKRVEDFLVDTLERAVPLYGLRDNVRAALTFYSWRSVMALWGQAQGYGNSIFGPNLAAEKVYRLVPIRQFERVRELPKTANIEALESLMAMAKADKVPVAVYHVPYPHFQRHSLYWRDSEGLERFLARVASACRTNGFVYRDLSSLVPLEYWRLPDAEASIEISHFQVSGHRILAGALELLVNEMKARQRIAVQ